VGTWGSRANAVARRLGWEVHRYDPSQSLHARRLAVLRRTGTTVVFDVGANCGQYGLLLRRTGYSGRIASFEPVSVAFEDLERESRGDSLWECRRLALGDREGNQEIGVSANLASSSFLGMEDRLVESDAESAYVAQESVPVVRLDSAADELTESDDRIYLKLDVQGYELRVLRGAPETLEKVQAIELELSLVPLYEDQPEVGELLEFVRSAGFEPFSLEPCFVDPRSGQMLQLDGLFVRSPPAGDRALGLRQGI
jgi:FkbM family methyltransferase